MRSDNSICSSKARKIFCVNSNDQKQKESRKACKDVHEKDVTIVLLKKEIESALESLKEVKAEMARLHGEKEQMFISEKQNEKNMEHLTAQVLTLQTAMSNFEKQSELKIEAVNHKLQTFEQNFQEAGSHWYHTKEILELEVGDAKIVAAQKAAEASCIFAKFEEAQDAMREADIMINGLMIANESMKLDIKRLKQVEVTVKNERDILINEVHSLQSINDQKDQQFEILEKQFGSNLIETRDLVVELEHIIADVQKTFREKLMPLAYDFKFIKSLLSDSKKLVSSWLEDVWSEIIVKDCAMAVLHLCHMGILLETVTGLNAENGLLQHGLSESNCVIADLREHNLKSRRELEMCRALKGKLLADIKRNFDQISSKEEEAGELSGKLITFEKKISDLQLQEDMMFQRSNYMGSQLALLMKELDMRNTEIVASLLDQERLIQDKEEIFKSESDLLMLDLCSKDFESLVLASELEEISLQKTEAERMNICCYSAIDSMKKELIFSNVDAEFKELLLLDKEAEVTILQKELEEVQNERQDLLSKLKQSSLTITQLDEVKKALEQDVELLQEAAGSNILLKSELGEVKETKVTLLNQVQELEAECDRLQKDIKIKETELESCSSSVSFLDQQNQKQQMDICLLENSLCNLKIELDVKDVELSRMRSLEEENSLLKGEVKKLETENSLFLQELEEKKSEFESSRSRIDTYDMENHRLHDKVLSLETGISGLQTDLEMKNAELNELHHSQSVIMEDLRSKSQDLQIYFDKVNNLREVNVSLENNIRILENEKHKSLSVSCQNVSKCKDSVETVDLTCYRLSNKMNEEVFMIADEMFQVISENSERISKFINDFECLQCHVEVLMSENQTLQAEQSRKDDVLEGLLFDLSLLQESASNTKDQKDEIDRMVASLEALEDDLALKSSELDEAVAHSHSLEAQLREKINVISNLEADISGMQEKLQSISHENLELRTCIEETLVEKSSLQEELAEHVKITKSLEMELQEMGNALGQMNDMNESLRGNLNELTSERDNLCMELHGLKEKLEREKARAEENEATAMEAQQVAESTKIHAEEKDAEVKLLERSVEELECTINVLENKVNIVKGEAERQRLQREELELELHTVKHQMQNVESADAEMKRQLDEKEKNLRQALNQVQILQRDIAEKETEIAQCKTHISELNLHAEAQASEYKQKFKALETMVEQVRPDSLSSHVANSSSNKIERNASRPRGSGSPFKCIGLGLAQQIKLERDEELTSARLRIEELESLAVNRQKEIFSLNARLAAAESMTHDVIRDLLGVKLDMTNYVSLLDNQQVQKITEKARLNNIESQVKDQEVIKLKHQLIEFIEERRGWLEEIERKQAEVVAAQVALEKLRQRDQTLKTENEMLKMENVNYKKMVMELEGEVKKLSGQQNIHQRIHHHAKIKEENNMLKIQNEDLSAKLRRTEVNLLRVKEELAQYRASNGKNPCINFDVEERLNNKLKESEEERMQLAQKLIGLCTGVLKAAGITKAIADVDPAIAEDALEQLKNKVNSQERELQNLKLKNRINNERNRLSEIVPQSSPVTLRTDENCRSPRRVSQSSFLSALDR